VFEHSLIVTSLSIHSHAANGSLLTPADLMLLSINTAAYSQQMSLNITCHLTARYPSLTEMILVRAKVVESIKNVVWQNNYLMLYNFIGYYSVFKIARQIKRCQLK
jgi:hypothetical protein